MQFLAVAGGVTVPEVGRPSGISDRLVPGREDHHEVGVGPCELIYLLGRHSVISHLPLVIPAIAVHPRSGVIGRLEEVGEVLGSTDVLACVAEGLNVNPGFGSQAGKGVGVAVSGGAGRIKRIERVATGGNRRGQDPAPTAEPITCVPWPERSLQSLGRWSACQPTMRPAKSALMVERLPVSKPESPKPIIWPAPYRRF